MDLHAPGITMAKDRSIVVINVYKRFLFLDKNAFINVFFIFPTFFIFKKTLNGQRDNMGILEYFSTIMQKNQSATHRILSHFVCRFTYF